MKSANGYPIFLLLILRRTPWHKFADALFHFAGGFVGEGDGDDVSGSNPFFDQVGNAEGDDSRFPRAGSGENEDGAVDGFNGESLLGVERGQVKTHGLLPLRLAEPCSGGSVKALESR